MDPRNPPDLPNSNPQSKKRKHKQLLPSRKTKGGKRIQASRSSRQTLRNDIITLSKSNRRVTPKTCRFPSLNDAKAPRKRLRVQDVPEHDQSLQANVSNAKIKTKKFTLTEDSNLCACVSTLCKQHNILPRDIPSLLRDYRLFDELCALWLARFADRTTDQLHQRALQLYQPARTGSFSPAEDDYLRTMHNLHGPNWDRIGQIMQRTPGSVRGRFLVLGPRPAAKGPWQEQEASRFREAIELQRDSVATWRLLAMASLAVGTRDYADCVEFWNTHPLHRGNSAWTADQCIALLQIIKDHLFKSEADLSFYLLAQHPTLAQYSPQLLRSRWVDLRQFHAHRYGSWSKPWPLMTDFMLRKIRVMACRPMKPVGHR